MGVTSREALKFSVFIIIFFSLAIPLGFNWQTAAQTSTPNSTYFLMVGHIGAGTIFLSDSNGFTDTYPSLFHNQVNEDSYPNTYQYVLGAIVQVTAKASTPNYVFDHWLLDGKPYTTNSLTVTMDSNHTLMACFNLTRKPNTWLLKLDINDYIGAIIFNGSDGKRNSVTIESSSHPLIYNVTQYIHGSIVNVSSVTDTDFVFDHWILDGKIYTDKSMIITMDRDHSLKAYYNFVRNTDEWVLRISRIGNGTVHVYVESSSPIGGVGYHYGKDITYRVTQYKHQNGWDLGYWILDGTIYTARQINVTMNKNHNLVAVFVPYNYTLSISSTAGGYTNPAGTQAYPVETPDYGGPTRTINVTAYPDNGYTFDHWIYDGITKTGNPITVSTYPTEDKNHTLTACFKPESTTPTLTATPAPTGMPTPSTLPQDEWVLSVSQVGSGSVQIRKSDTGAPVGATGTFRYPDGQTVTVQTYKHHDGWRLDHWLLDGVPYTDWKINITMNSDHTVVAYFVPWNFTLSISCSNGGYTDPAGDQIYPVMAPDYPLTKKVTVTAYPYDNYRFDHWLWDGTTNTDNPITVSMDPVFDKNHTLQAIFILSTDTQGQFVGSKNGEVYHYPTCSYVASINAENKIWFVDAQDAVNQKYEPCSRCNPPRPNTNTPTPTTSPTTMATIAPTPAPTPMHSPTTPTSTATPALTLMPDPTSTTVPLQTSTPAPAPTQDGIQPTSTPIKTATPVQTTLPPTSMPTQSPDPADSPQPPTASPEPTEMAAPSDVPTNTVAPIQNQTTQNSNSPSPNLSPNPQAQEAPNITVIVVLAAMILIAILLTIFKGKSST